MSSNIAKSHKQTGRWGGLLLVLMVGVGLLGLLGSVATSAKAAADWQDSPLKLDASKALVCVDGGQANSLLLSSGQLGDGGLGMQNGTYSMNWKTGATSRISDIPFASCDSENGLVYGKNASGQTVRFSSRDPQGQVVAHVPCFYAHDGSRMAYTCDNNYDTGSLTIFASSDGGLTWQQRPRVFTGKYIRMTMAQSDGHALYVIACSDQYPGFPSDNCKLYFSGDGGLNWEDRGLTHLKATVFNFMPVPGHNTPRDYILVEEVETGVRRLKLSTDGGRSFRLAASYGVCDSPHPDSLCGSSDAVELFETNRGLLRYSYSSGTGSRVELSTDGGVSWQNLPPMPQPVAAKSNPELMQLPSSLDSFIWLDHSAGGYIWLTSDGGQSWQKVGPSRYNLSLTPYAPATLLNLAQGQVGPVATLDLFQADHAATAPAPASGATGSAFYAPTGHNLPAVFRGYWQQKGGLAQFGYPRTEPLREVNAADGKVYLVQYFERNRFEYHPEYAGTQYEILLGLLGNEQTANRHSEKPFQPVTNPNRTDTLYFAATGHTIAHSFRTYWEQHGGLAIYGYPVSEEFEEVNPDDGQTYVVQYFERNRFEYHPANKGTPYEVLLGLLGNTLLKQKGWL